MKNVKDGEEGEGEEGEFDTFVTNFKGKNITVRDVRTMGKEDREGRKDKARERERERERESGSKQAIYEKNTKK